MTIMGLNVPTDIVWERMCVSKDMMDPIVCDSSHPPNFSSSLALFKYVPEEEYQVYSDRKIIYLKLVCSITGYHPKEIEGIIDWSRAKLHEIKDIETILREQKPCTGALVQVTVGPQHGVKIPIENYPYIMDYQPKKRDMYELSTSTNEKLSRSLEGLSTGKSVGTTNSMEVLDIDGGGGSSEEVGITILGSGPKVGTSGNNIRQVGTKSLGTLDNGLTRTTDESRERRELQSHVTQITSLYHLLESYHLGTNRVLFFISPRPYVNEEPSGFVKGPRAIEGIQEFFLVVNQPKDLELCVSARLDTGHFDEEPILDYYYTKDLPMNFAANASVPTKEEVEANPKIAPTSELVQFWSGGESSRMIDYNCFLKTEFHTPDPYIYRPPFTGLVIDTARPYNILESSKFENGDKSIKINTDGESAEVRCWATAHICLRDPNYYEQFGMDGSTSAPATQNGYGGSASLDIEFNLRSKYRIIPVGKTKRMFVSSRALCCCPGTDPADLNEASVTEERPHEGFEDEKIVDEAVVGTYYFNETDSGYNTMRHEMSSSVNSPSHSSDQRLVIGREMQKLASRSDMVHRNIMTAKDANELSDLMRNNIKASLGSRRRLGNNNNTLALNIFIRKLTHLRNLNEEGRKLLSSSSEDFLSEELSTGIKKVFNKDPEKIKRSQILSLGNEKLKKITGLDENSVNMFRLKLLGVPLKKRPNPQSLLEPKSTKKKT